MRKFQDSADTVGCSKDYIVSNCVEMLLSTKKTQYKYLKISLVIQERIISGWWYIPYDKILKDDKQFRAEISKIYDGDSTDNLLIRNCLDDATINKMYKICVAYVKDVVDYLKSNKQTV